MTGELNSMRVVIHHSFLQFRHAWLFSFCINLLLLISPLYMLQVSSASAACG